MACRFMSQIRLRHEGQFDKDQQNDKSLPGGANNRSGQKANVITWVGFWPVTADGQNLRNQR